MSAKDVGKTKIAASPEELLTLKLPIVLSVQQDGAMQEAEVVLAGHASRAD